MEVENVSEYKCMKQNAVGMKNKKWLGNKIEQEIYKGQDHSKASLCDFNISQDITIVL